MAGALVQIVPAVTVGSYSTTVDLSGAKGYQIKYSTSKKFTKKTTKTVKVKKATKTVTKLRKVKVRK